MITTQHQVVRTLGALVVAIALANCGVDESRVQEGSGGTPSGGTGGASGNGGNDSAGGDSSGGSVNAGGDSSGGSVNSGGDGSGGSTGAAGNSGGDGGTAGGGTAGSSGSSGTAGTGGTGPNECDNGDRRCQLGTPEECQNGQWASLAACDVAPDLYCYQGICLPCSPGTYRCVGNTPEVCTPLGDWEAQMPCVNPTPVCNAQNGTCSNMVLVGGFTTPGRIDSAAIRLHGEFLLLPRSCDSGATICLRGGFVP